MRHLYPLSCYDAEMCLKPPIMLWAAALYLSRAIILPLAMALGHFAGVDDRAISVFRDFWNLYALAPSLVAAVVLYALCRRTAGATATVRAIWARGRVLLVGAAILDLALLLLPAIRQGPLGDPLPTSVFAATVDLYFLVYLLAARRVRQVFREFPSGNMPGSSHESGPRASEKPSS